MAASTCSEVPGYLLPKTAQRLNQFGNREKIAAVKTFRKNRERDEPVIEHELIYSELLSKMRLDVIEAQQWSGFVA